MRKRELIFVLLYNAILPQKRKNAKAEQAGVVSRQSSIAIPWYYNETASV
jgi:hypothetical protein